MIVSAYPASARGAIANVTNARRAAMDAGAPRDERRASGRAKSRGPGLPTLGSSRRTGDVGVRPTRREPPATEANKPGTPGRARISRKPLRRECRCFGVPAAFFLCMRAAGATGASGAYCALLISRAAKRCMTRASLAAGMRSCASLAVPPPRYVPGSGAPRPRQITAMSWVQTQSRL
jgi:hypothetical protein